MKSNYFDEDDTLVIYLSDKSIAREVSQDQNTHISYAADGTAVELATLEAKAHGMLPETVIRSR